MSHGIAELYNILSKLLVFVRHRPCSVHMQKIDLVSKRMKVVRLQNSSSQVTITDIYQYRRPNPYHASAAPPIITDSMVTAGDIGYALVVALQKQCVSFCLANYKLKPARRTCGWQMANSEMCPRDCETPRYFRWRKPEQHSRPDRSH